MVSKVPMEEPTLHQQREDRSNIYHVQRGDLNVSRMFQEQERGVDLHYIVGSGGLEFPGILEVDGRDRYFMTSNLLVLDRLYH